MFAAPDHDTNNEADFQDSYTNLIIGAHTNHHINHSPAVKYYNPNNLNNTQLHQLKYDKIFRNCQ